MGNHNRLVGQVLHDTYRIERLIGEGGMGAVFEASHLRLARRFAIKVLSPDADPDAVARLRREAEITSRLGNPHIVEVIDFYQMPDGEPYIVMELLEGDDLAARIQAEQRLGLPAVVSVVRQSALGLQAAHDAGVVHRDLKPHNIFLCRRGKRENFVKIVDFGISKMLDAHSGLTGALAGTPSYMAPEQAEERPNDIETRTDVYAMGCILYEMLTGGPPFVASSVPALLYKIVHQEPPELPPQLEIPDDVRHVVRKALQKRPADRFRSITAFSTELTIAAQLTPVVADQPTEDRSRAWSMIEEPDEQELRATTEWTPARRAATLAEATALVPGRKTDLALADTVAAGAHWIPAQAPDLVAETPHSAGPARGPAPILPTRRTRFGIWAGAVALGLATIAGGVILLGSPDEPGPAPGLAIGRADLSPPPDLGRPPDLGHQPDRRALPDLTASQVAPDSWLDPAAAPPDSRAVRAPRTNVRRVVRSKRRPALAPLRPAPKPRKPEPQKPEPQKPEPPKPEPQKSEPKKKLPRYDEL